MLCKSWKTIIEIVRKLKPSELSKESLWIEMDWPSSKDVQESFLNQRMLHFKEIYFVVNDAPKAEREISAGVFHGAE